MSNPYRDESIRIQRNVEADLWSALGSARPVLLYGPHGSGKTDLLRQLDVECRDKLNRQPICVKAKELSEPCLIDDLIAQIQGLQRSFLFEGSLPSAEWLVLIDDLDWCYRDECQPQSQWYNTLDSSRVVCTVQEQNRARFSSWADWQMIPVAFFDKAETRKLIVVKGGIGSLLGDDTLVSALSDAVWQLTRGHPGLTRKVCEFLIDTHGKDLEALATQVQKRPNYLDELVCSDANNVQLLESIASFIRSSFDKPGKERKILTLIARMSKLTDPPCQQPAVAPVKSSLLGPVLRYMRRWFTRYPGNTAEQPTSGSDSAPSWRPLTTNSLKNSSDAQPWYFPGEGIEKSVIDLLDALDILDHEGLIQYDPTRGWTMIPLLNAYYRARDDKAIEELDLKEMFP